MSPGFWMYAWSAGPTTVDAKSGRVSRSRNCERFFASSIVRTAFFCSAEYELWSARLFAAMTDGSYFSVMFTASGVARYDNSAFAPSGYRGLLDIMKPSIGASTTSAPMAASNSG